MKIKFYLIVLLSIMAFVSCEKKPVHQETTMPTETEAPPTPAPAITPGLTTRSASTPQPETLAPTPPAKMTPEGTVIVIHRFSATGEHGVYGFAVGTKVKIIEEDPANYTVSDGTFTGTAPKSYFTNDLNEAEKLAEISTKKQIETKEVQKRNHQQLLEQRKKDEIQRQSNVADAKKERIRNQLTQLDAAISDVSKLLDDVYRAKSRGGYIYNSEGYVIGARSSSSSGNEFQLKESLRKLQNQRATLQETLRQLEN